jgi:hypothetical protein
VFGRRTKQNALARVAEQDSSWLRDSRLRQLFHADLEDGERILHLCEATATSASFDRPITGWVVATDRAIRLRWGFGTAVRQSLHVGYDRIRSVEVAAADPQDAHVRYFDAARPTVGWYQDLRLRADSGELTQALPQLVSAHQARIAEQVEAPQPTVDVTQLASIPAQGHSMTTEELVARSARSRLAAGTHKRRRRLARR